MSGLMQAVNEEFAKFERKEAEFRKKEREERAAKLKMPVEKYDTIGHRRSNQNFKN